jgi:hypothetical protein
MSRSIDECILLLVWHLNEVKADLEGWREILSTKAIVFRLVL